MNFIKLKEELDAAIRIYDICMVKRYIANSPKTKDSVRPNIAGYICSLAKIAYLVFAVPQCLGHSLSEMIVFWFSWHS